MPYVLEHDPVVICQCYVPCFRPYESEPGVWSSVGCGKYRGHPGPHGPDEEEKPARVGPRIRLRPIEPDGSSMYQGRCWNCGAVYTLREEDV